MTVNHLCYDVETTGACSGEYAEALSHIMTLQSQ